ncbi:MAG: hypothetical protein A2169_09100 [Deltaproteobacteria bacterium RBG_13_47_9]|nr:MAG: hypothetical protein A2169_09100 [Deltaproteobacteria bacterium RBG_13_47_9]
MGFGRFSKPGPGFFSLLAGLTLGFLSIIIFFRAWISKKLHEKISNGRIDWKSLILAFGSLVGFTLFLKTLGFNLTTFLFIGVLLRAVGKKTWTVSVLAALSISLGAYIVFGPVLQSQLPKGPFGFLGF